MPDGTRRRRHSPIAAKRRWYAEHRAERFAKRFSIYSWVNAAPGSSPALELAFDVTHFGTAVMNAASPIRFSSHWSGFVDPVGEQAAVA